LQAVTLVADRRGAALRISDALPGDIREFLIAGGIEQRLRQSEGAGAVSLIALHGRANHRIREHRILVEALLRLEVEVRLPDRPEFGARRHASFGARAREG